ncbi:MAG TPA: hypothetical protein VE133_03410 [Candidatus Sulfotelmatobacter sp.]|nr:hypothetical protein [Candidatus Sulfotelmatobacter sp.]
MNVVEWGRNPDLVFRALRSGSELPPAEPEVCYRTYVSRDIPDLVRCEQLFNISAESEPA